MTSIDPAPDPAGFGRCGVCPYRETGPPVICASCAEASFEGLAAERCEVCDRPLSSETACKNRLCRSAERAFERNYAIAMRSGPLERAINRYKYEGKREWAYIFARVLIGKLEWGYEVFRHFDLIVASPCYTGVGATRDWSHTQLVLDRAAEAATGWPFDVVVPPAIAKLGPTPQMMGKKWHQRRVIAVGDLRASLYVPDPDRVQGKSVLIYDDVFTDGQTLNEVARALRTAGGAARVCGVTLARQPFRPPAAS